MEPLCLPGESDFVADRHVLEPFGSGRPHDESGNEPFRRRSDVASYFHHTASKEYQGQLLWSDLHWSELDAAQPDEDKQVEVSVQQTVTDALGKFAGVVRVGLLAAQLDRAVQLRLTAENEDDPHRVFLCDFQGRLITRGVSSDMVKLSGDDLRLAPADLAPEVESALADPKLRAVGEDTSRRIRAFSAPRA